MRFERSGSSFGIRLTSYRGRSNRPVVTRLALQVAGAAEIDVESGRMVTTGGHLRLTRTARRPPNVRTLQPINGATVSFPSYFRFLKYAELVADPAIQGALYFDRPGGGLSYRYDYWTPAQRLQLDEYMYLLETSRPLPITGPPAVSTSYQVMSGEDGTRIYLSHVAQSLWAEATDALPWKIRGSNARTLEYLFDSRRLLTRAATPYYFGNGTMGIVTDWNVRYSYEFLRDNTLIGADQFETVRRFADWGRSNLSHIAFYASDPNGPFATQEDQWEWLYGYRGFPPVNLVLTPPPNRAHVTHGCWGTSGLLAAVLRSVNIPVHHGRSNLGGGIHSRPEFFSVGQNLAHSDDVYSRAVGRGHHTPPIDVIFYTDAALAAEIDAPMPAAGQTVPQAASLNYQRKFAQLAVQYKTDYLLGCRCYDINNGNAQPTVTWSRLWQFLNTVYSNTELTQIASDCDTETAALGGCGQIPPI